MIRQLILSSIAILMFQIASAQDNKIEIIYILAPDCPISQKYITRIKEIHAQYVDQASIKYYFPETFTNQEVANFIADYDLEFQISIDKKNKTIKRLEASITPEVFVLVNTNIEYSGAIDNWFYALGKNRLNVNINYLIDAIEALKKDNKPEIIKTRAVGCQIN